jgi:hypothetical protein
MGYGTFRFHILQTKFPYNKGVRSREYRIFYVSGQSIKYIYNVRHHATKTYRCYTTEKAFTP